MKRLSSKMFLLAHFKQARRYLFAEWRVTLSFTFRLLAFCDGNMMYPMGDRDRCIGRYIERYLDRHSTKHRSSIDRLAVDGRLIYQLNIDRYIDRHSYRSIQLAFTDTSPILHRQCTDTSPSISFGTSVDISVGTSVDVSLDTSVDSINFIQ